jgi:hypothetical protein
MPLLPIRQEISNRPADAGTNGDVEYVVNRVLVPVLKAVLNGFNVLARELNGGTIRFVDFSPLVLDPGGSDGDLCIWKNGPPGYRVWFRAAGSWEDIA